MDTPYLSSVNPGSQCQGTHRKYKGSTFLPFDSRVGSYVEDEGNTPETKSSSLAFRFRKPSGKTPNTYELSPNLSLASPNKGSKLSRNNMDRQSKSPIPGELKKANGLTATYVEPTSSGAGMTSFKEGESVLAQIGSPDHSGWMRKRGDRYNQWKSRYFVLKGHDMYILKSNSKSVCFASLPRNQNRFIYGLHRKPKRRAISISWDIKY